MLYTAQINVLPLKELLDPQGKAVEHGLKSMNFNSIQNIRIGKHIVLKLEATNEAEAKQIVEDACKKLLHNPVMEFYEFVITEG